MVVGVLQARRSAPSHRAPDLPGAILAASHDARGRRRRKTPRSDTWKRYRPLLGVVLIGWERSNLSLILDGTWVGNGRWTIGRLSIAHGGRAIPGAWTVRAGTGRGAVERRAPMRRSVARWLERRVRQVPCLADRGLHDDRWAKRVRTVGWDYAMRWPCRTTVTLRDGATRRLAQRGVAVGKTGFFQDVRITAEGQGRAHLAIPWTLPTAKQPAAIVAVMANRKANRQRLRGYLKRMQIEQSFRADTSADCDREPTTVDDPARSERVLCTVALAPLWCHDRGEAVLQTEPRRRVDPGWKRELRICQRGLRWLARCLATFPRRLSSFTASLSPMRLLPCLPKRRR